MKLRFLILLLMTLFPSPEQSGTLLWTRTPATVGTSYTLLYDSVGVGGSANNVLESNFRYYSGLSRFVDATPRTIGKVAFKLSKAGTDISGFTFVARIWSMTGDSLNVQQAASVGVPGNNSWSETTVEFTFSSPFTTTGSTEYGIAIDRGGIDASSYITMYYTPISGGLPTIPPGYIASWWNSKNFPAEGTLFVPQMKIYTTP